MRVALRWNLVAMEATYRIVDCRWQSGERYPMLVNADTGLPPWEPMLFVTTQLRNTNKSFATMEAALGAIQVLLAFAEAQRIDLEQRILSQQYLTVSELDALCDWAGRSHRRDANRCKPHRAETICKAHRYNRLTWIASYLAWYRDAVAVAAHAPGADEPIQKLVRAIRARRPRWGREGPIRDRALTSEQWDRLIELVEPSHPDNPFRDPRAAERNALLVLMLAYVGLRRGELLGLQVPDIDWQQQTLTIHRRPDNPQDPRTRQPRTKTLARTVPVPRHLIEQIDRYVRETRRSTKGANTHSYLLVVHRKGPQEGEPLSESGLTKVFAILRRSDPLLAPLHPHTLRHTWNWKFSQGIDQSPKESRPSQAEEDRARSHLMGWREGSGSAARYNRRHIEKQAAEAARLMYEKAVGRKSQQAMDT